MKYWVSFLMFMLATFFQGNLANLITIFGITPNILLCLVVMFSFLYSDEYHGVIWGTLFGIVSDVLYMQYVGISALGYFIIALLVIAGSYIFNREQSVTIVILMTIATVAFNVYSFALTYLMGSGVSVFLMLKQLPMMVIYNVLLTAVLYQVFIGKVVRFRSDRYFR